MKEMIRRYDEVISQKANKLAIKELYEHLDQYLKKNSYMDFRVEVN
jgi:hypothetical protein